jgi:hypothetical protein
MDGELSLICPAGRPQWGRRNEAELTLFGGACAQLCVRRLSSDRRASLPSVNRRGARNFVSTVRLFCPVAVRRRFPPGIVLRRRRRHMRRLPGRHPTRLSPSRLVLHKQTFCLSVSVLRTPPTAMPVAQAVLQSADRPAPIRPLSPSAYNISFADLSNAPHQQS